MSEYSMPSYFQSMPVIGKDLSAFHEDNAAEIQAVEQQRERERQRGQQEPRQRGRRERKPCGRRQRTRR